MWSSAEREGVFSNVNILSPSSPTLSHSLPPSLSLSFPLSLPPSLLSFPLFPSLSLSLPLSLSLVDREISYVSHINCNTLYSMPYSIMGSDCSHCLSNITPAIPVSSRYSGHYEGLVRSLYSQLYQKERQIEQWRKKAETISHDNHTEALVTAGELTHTALLGTWGGRGEGGA